MRAIKYACLGIALGAIVPGVLRATDTFSWTNFCTSGSLKSCASVEIVTTCTVVGCGSGGMTVTLRLRNLAGWTGGSDNTGGSFLTAIGILVPDVGTVSHATNWVAATGDATQLCSSETKKQVTTTTCPQSDWASAADATIEGIGGGNGVQLRLADVTNPEKNGAIQGCIISSNPIRYFQTCNNSTGWIEFTFQTSLQWHASDAQLAWKVQGAGPNGVSLECRTDTDQYGTLCGPPNVTPEPVTMVLLGSGLAGMGGAGLIRRRNKKGDVENA